MTLTDNIINTEKLQAKIMDDILLTKTSFKDITFEDVNNIKKIFYNFIQHSEKRVKILVGIGTETPYVIRGEEIPYKPIMETFFYYDEDTVSKDELTGIMLFYPIWFII